MAPKRLVQDIVPKKSRIRKVVRTPVPTSKFDDDYNEIPIIIKKKSSKKPVEIEEINIEKDKKTNKVFTKSKYSKVISFGIVFVCIAIIAIALSLLYTKAVVTIVPVTLPININGSFIAKKDSNNVDVLNYQVVTVNLDEYKTVPAVDGPLIETKAKGIITLYNNYSTANQKLLAGTRISNGTLIYKLTWSVTVPGQKTVSGKIVPGSVDVEIIADKAGANYNLTLPSSSADFRIVAYKGSAKYTGFSGKLKRNIIGGFSGKNKIIDSKIEKDTIVDIQNSLKEKLLNNAKSSMIDGLVLFDNAYTIEYEKLPQKTIDSDTTSIGMKGTLYGIIFNSRSLIDYIAKKQIEDNHLSIYKIDGLNELNFSIINTKDESAKKGTPLSFSLKGPIKITGTFSENEFKNKLIGLKLDQMNPIVKQYPSIKSVSVLLTPFWMRSFPNTVESIIIEYK